MARRKSDIINLDTEAFELLSRQVKAKEEENRISQQTLTALKRRELIFNDVIERYANQSEQVKFWHIRLDAIESKIIELEQVITSAVGPDSAAVTMLKSYAGILREITEEISNRFDLFEIELSRRIGRLEDIETARLSSDIINPDDAATWLSGLAREKKRRELRQHYFNLQEFREQSAKYGINVPISLVNEITYAEQRIAELEADLSATKQ